MAGSPERDPRQRADMVGVAHYLGHGFTLAASTLLFLWLGTKADGWLGTEPWLALLGAMIGAGAGFYHMYHHLIVVPQQGHRDRNRDGRDPE